ncbi:MAG: hybrid sensor histidine kinase/response regulator [Elainellaceae cyanobacterium]
MSQDKELEIQLQFLDEAQEYLDTIEAALIGLASTGVDSQKINAALRAAHSVKGGAAMMGFHALSQLAHRLEDGFKVLKVQKQTIAIDADLERLLLAGADCLRQVIDQSRHHQPPNQNWLETQAFPIFDQLHDQLGDPQAEDANSVLSPEEGQDIIPLLFETEVEGCLQRLETALEAHDPCLHEEVDILAQELGGLGEMLQIPAFSQLCQSIAQHLTANPSRTEAIATAALQAWRRSQALILTGNLNGLPTAIHVEGVTISEFSSELSEFPDFAEFANLTEAGFADLSEADFATLAGMDGEFGNISFGESELTNNENEFDEEGEFEQEDEFDTIELLHFGQEDVGTEEIPELKTQIIQPSAPTTASSSALPDAHHAAEFRISSDGSTSALPQDEPQDNTVRVPVKHLNQLNDLLGELTIERNRLDLYLKRMRSFVQTMNLRVQVLEQSNAQLRTTYDRISTQSDDLASPLLSIPNGVSLNTPEANHPFADPSSKFDALEMDRYTELHLLSQEMMETIVQIQEVSSDIELGLDDTEQINRDLHKTTKQLQISLSHVRMRPLSDVVDRFPKAIRELSLQHNKPVQLKVYGGHTLVDRNILESLSDPLLHLIRNAFDHGIEAPETRLSQGKPEQGLIEIRASHRNNRTIITIRDDGGGIPLEKVRRRARQMGLDEMLLAAASDEELLSLIFEPGFSTTDRVTDLSGRGIGMDVVRNNLKQIRGEITVNTQPGVGTTFTLSVPFTLSIARVLLAESGGMLMAFPTEVVEEVLVLQPEQVVATAGNEVIAWQDTMVQLIRLSRWLKFNCPRQMEGLETPPTINSPAVLMTHQGNQMVGLQIDRCWGEQEVALRKVEGNLPLPSGFNSCTILGDGRVVPLVNVPELLHWITSCDRSEMITTNPTLPFNSPASLQSAASLPHLPASQAALMPARKPTVLVVDDSINVRRLLALTLEKAGYQVAQAKDGQDALDKLLAGLQVQVVICDIEMPRLDGYGFLARVKASPDFEQLPVAMLTSRSGDKHRQLAMNLGATAYFSKPYNEQSLLQTLERLVNLVPAS